MNHQTRTFLALGDSYTIGEAVAETERWPVQLVSSLRKRNVSIADPVIVARTGWTTDELSAAIDTSDSRGPFDLVTLLIGVNNQYRGRSADEYRGEFKQLLQRAIRFANGEASHVVVVSIPDWGVMPFAEGRDRMKIAKEIDMFNAINWEESVRAGVQYVDITPLSREVERYPELIASDGLHPSGVQYKYWGELIEPKACTALGIAIEKEKK
ncbi:MAG: SGNH/GDSL hydrolase family protein [Bacteroidetes bacterium]|nr:SGNH/GDSL hydrolase family protein [Bacteroidota bacterium]MCW5895160.1 SGNH/GDSL hydrolase family protein [Bacteroidota bacterium]